MRIKKTFFSTEVELEISEIKEIRTLGPASFKYGLLIWLKGLVGMDLLPVFEEEIKDAAR